MSGPLSGIKVIEMAGIGPGPFCAMLLSDMGADVIRIDQKRNESSKPKPGFIRDAKYDLLNRGRRSIAIDLKKPGAVELVLGMIARSDALIEGFRPGVMERLGLGPDVCLARKPALVYGRMTGWGQTGPLANAAGHDLNYIALTGVASAIGTAQTPTPPLNLVGDFGGGAMFLAFGVACGLIEASRSGKGQVIDAAMTDGAALLSAAVYGLTASGYWTNKREDNLLDGGAHFYGMYECADGKFVSIGSIEPQFYALLLKLAGLDEKEFTPQMDRARWPELRKRLAAVMRTRTRDQWCQVMEGSDVCFAPVLDWSEAPQHPHNRARNTFIEIDGVTQPAPAPRFSRTPPKVQRPPSSPGEHSEAVLADFGVPADAVAALKRDGVI
ncbi:MAG: CoA transferase [Nevskia sp.]|nr:CoA transferase [Nevskia sp.]